MYRAGAMSCLAALVLVLPLFETPKTVFLCLFYGFAAAFIWQSRSRFVWRMDDGLLAFWMVSGYWVAGFAGLHYKEWDGATGLLKTVLFLLLLKLLPPLDDRFKHNVGLLVLLSTLIAAGIGLWRLWVSHSILMFELPSVGHVNHSAIYLGLGFALALATALGLNRRDTPVLKIFVAFSLAAIAFCIVVANSRATVLIMAVVALSFGLVWFKRSKRPLLMMVFVMSVGAAGLYLQNAPIIQKHAVQTEHGFLGERQAIWNTSLLAWRHHPWFGLGMKNFAAVSQQAQAEWLAEEGKAFVPGEYKASSHAHNFYLATLAEQGLFGSALVLTVFGRILLLLFKHRPQLADSDDYWRLWLGAFGAVQVVLINGLFNTTLHSEHGLLAMLLLGLWWSDAALRTQG